MQQINLYTEAFRPQKVILPLEHIVLLPVIFLILLAGVTVWLNSNLNDMEKNLVHLQEKNKSMQSRVNNLEEKAQKQRQDDSLVAANKRLSETIKARQEMMAMLDTVVVKDDDGFSSLLLSLARQKIEGLWLKEIHVSASGQDMRLEGTTLNANAVPTYLQELRAEPSFIGRTFTLFELEKSAAKRNQLNFSLRSGVSQSKSNMLISQFEKTRSQSGAEPKNEAFP